MKLPEVYVDGIDELVRLGKYSSRSEAIRDAIKDLLKRELWISDEELELKPLNKNFNIRVIKMR